MDVERSISNPRKVAVIGTYVPRRCGIATFTADLLQALSRQAPETEWSAVAVSDTPEGYDYPSPVRFEVNQKAVADYQLSVDLLNMSQVDIICLQHEFGIFGGADGSYVLEFLQGLRMPVVTTLHTVIHEPSRIQREIITTIGELSDRVVVMSETARRMLRRVYGIPDENISVIPHGVPDMPFLDPSYHKDQFGILGKKAILTFGLISPGKGIEYVIEAMPEVVRAHPDAVFIVAGATHPQVVRRDGEAYRLALQRRARDLGVDDHVIFHNQFLDAKTLNELLGAADICVTPYLSREQIVSGVLSYALGAGKAVVSTPYWYADEMLAQGRGKLVPFRDAGALAQTIVALFDDEAARHAMRKNAYVFAREMVWDQVAKRYMAVLNEVRGERAIRPRAIFQAKTLQAAAPDLPPLKFDHLRLLTDEVGILQHARFRVPNRAHGYCTDDNARALVVALMGQSQVTAAKDLATLAYRYMAFIQHAFNEVSGRFRNFMSYDRVWAEEVGSEDSHGRAVWALGRAVLLSSTDELTGAVLELFERALPAVWDMRSPRALGFCLLGAAAYLERFAGASDVRRLRACLADRLFTSFRERATDEWPWPEEVVTYANGLLPEALIVSGRQLERTDLIEQGLRSLRWLTERQTDPKGHFVPIGNRGWLARGGIQARFDQQPIEAQHMCEAYLAAHDATGEQFWISAARRSLEWFLGRNDLRQPLSDLRSGGCRDGLMADGANQNQGAESTLAWLHTLLTFHARAAAAASTPRVIDTAIRPPIRDSSTTIHTQN
jgi:glycosyltransferase involved in cell wall biosynthesis